ncbi:MAG: efflux RND transporter periplasmic adaptor subunit [Gammaproteobacteria bacterium]|nr:efflux RND transporter periplasmic adaptor subunit [Gammaproteobacteria bacterium]
MFLRLLFVVLLLAGIFGGIFGWKQHNAQLTAAAQGGGPPPAVIATTRAALETWQPALQVVGSLAAVSGIEVTSEVSGKVKAIRFQSGQAVEQGELLIELDDETDQAELKGLQAERTIARLRHDRLAKLVREKTISKSDFDEARANLDAASARVAAQQALIDKKRIRAPFSGRLGIRRVDLGEYLGAGTAIVPLEQLDPILVDFTLPERELARVAVGQEITLKVQAYPEETFTGTIEAIDPGVIVANRSFRVRARLENPEQRLRPGMFADVSVKLPQEDDVITIPDTAISYAPYGNSVFVIVESEGSRTVSRRQIETGQTRNGRVAVVSGLQVDEQVVSAGHNKLRNGQAVVIDDRPAPAERPASTQAAP